MKRSRRFEKEKSRRKKRKRRTSRVIFVCWRDMTTTIQKTIHRAPPYLHSCKHDIIAYSIQEVTTGLSVTVFGLFLS